MADQKKGEISLPFKIKWLFGIGDITCDLTGTFKNYYWTFFLTDIMHVGLAVTGIISTLTYVGDWICSFLSGIITDAFKPGKWGKYRKVVLLTTIIAAVGYIGMWAGPLIEQSTFMAVVTVVSAVVFSVFVTIATTANSTLITIMAKNEAEKGLLFSHRWAYQKISGLSVSYIILAVMTLVGKSGGSESTPYVITGCLFAVLYIIGYGFHFAMAKGYDVTEVKEENRVGIKDMIQTLIVNKHLLWGLLANMCACIGGMLFSMFVTYVFEYTYDASELLTPYISSTSAAALVASLVVGKLIQKFEIIKIARVCSITMCGLLVVLMLFCKTSLAAFWVVNVLIQFFSSMAYVNFLTYIANCATYSEWKTGKKANAVVVGITNIPIKFGLVMAGIFIPIALAKSGYDAGLAREVVGQGILKYYALIPLIGTIPEALIEMFGYKLTSAEVAKMEAEIAERNAQ